MDVEGDFATINPKLRLSSLIQEMILQHQAEYIF